MTITVTMSNTGGSPKVEFDGKKPGASAKLKRGMVSKVKKKIEIKVVTPGGGGGGPCVVVGGTMFCR